MLGVPSLLHSNTSCVDNDSQNEDTAAICCFCVETGINKMCE